MVPQLPKQSSSTAVSNAWPPGWKIYQNLTFAFSPFIGKGDQPSQGPSFNFPSHDGPPTVDDMVHAQGNDDKYHKTRAICEDLLKTFHLDWNDVQGEKITQPKTPLSPSIRSPDMPSQISSLYTVSQPNS